MVLVPYGDDIKRRRAPIVNSAIILANLAVFVKYAMIEPQYAQVVSVHGFVPAQWTVASAFTSMFLHADVLHLLGNMLFLFVVGDNVEDRFGHLPYTLFYALAGVVAIGSHACAATGDAARIPTIGASGAVSGAMGAYLVLYPFNAIKLFFYVIPIRIPAFAFIGLWIATQWLLVRAEQQGQATSIAVWAHLGGFAFGFVVALVFRLVEKKPPADK